MSYGATFLRNATAGAAAKFKASVVSGFRLQPADVSTLLYLVSLDRDDSFYKACVSVVMAFSAISRHLPSWAIVNLYYATFYCAKCRLEAGGECHIYFDSTPYSIEVRNGGEFKKGKGTSHSYAFAQFALRFPSLTSLSQPISGLDPLNWIKLLRERVQYNDPFDDEKAVHQHCANFSLNEPYRNVRAYFGRNATTYAYDLTHAGIAFPILIFSETARAFANGNTALLTREQFEFIDRRCYVAQSRVSEVSDLIRPLVSF